MGEDYALCAEFPRQMIAAASGMIHNLDPNDPEILYFKAVNIGGCGAINSVK